MSTLLYYESLIGELLSRAIIRVFKILHEISSASVLGSLAVLREASNGHYWMGRACSFRDLIGPTRTLVRCSRGCFRTWSLFSRRSLSFFNNETYGCPWKKNARVASRSWTRWKSFGATSVGRWLPDIVANYGPTFYQFTRKIRFASRVTRCCALAERQREEGREGEKKGGGGKRTRERESRRWSTWLTSARL